MFSRKNVLHWQKRKWHNFNDWPEYVGLSNINKNKRIENELNTVLDKASRIVVGFPRQISSMPKISSNNLAKHVFRISVGSAPNISDESRQK